MECVRRFAQMEDEAPKKATFSDAGGECGLVCQMWERGAKSAPYLVKKCGRHTLVVIVDIIRFT